MNQAKTKELSTHARTHTPREHAVPPTLCWTTYLCCWQLSARNDDPWNDWQAGTRGQWAGPSRRDTASLVRDSSSDCRCAGGTLGWHRSRPSRGSHRGHDDRRSCPSVLSPAAETNHHRRATARAAPATYQQAQCYHWHHASPVHAQTRSPAHWSIMGLAIAANQSHRPISTTATLSHEKKSSYATTHLATATHHTNKHGLSTSLLPPRLCLTNSLNKLWNCCHILLLWALRLILHFWFATELTTNKLLANISS